MTANDQYDSDYKSQRWQQCVLYASNADDTGQHRLY